VACYVCRKLQQVSEYETCHSLHCEIHFGTEDSRSRPWFEGARVPINKSVTIWRRRKISMVILNLCTTAQSYDNFLNICRPWLFEGVYVPRRDQRSPLGAKFSPRSKVMLLKQASGSSYIYMQDAWFLWQQMV
jgi:hypothetical protein